MNVLYWDVGHMGPQTITKEVSRLVEADDIDVACLHKLPFEDNHSITKIVAAGLNMHYFGVTARVLSHTNKNGLKAYSTAIFSKRSIIDGAVQDLRTETLTGWNHRSVLLWARTKEDPDLTIAAAQLSQPRPLGLDYGGVFWERVALQETLEGCLEQSNVLFGSSMNTPPGGRLDTRLGSIGLRHVVAEGSDPTPRRLPWRILHRHTSPNRVFASKGLDAAARLGERQPSPRNDPLIVTAF
jgi:hypothetical protein